MKTEWRFLAITALLAAAVVLLAGCQGASASGTQTPLQPVLRGDPARGRGLLAAYGCGSCHTIPGVEAANSMAGPPLDAWSDRRYIAGAIANTPDTLAAWIQDPQVVEPGTAMPDLNVSEQDAWDMAAYLFTLKREHGADGR